jgi:hypothetical protein
LFVYIFPHKDNAKSLKALLPFQEQGLVQIVNISYPHQLYGAKSREDGNIGQEILYLDW